MREPIEDRLAAAGLPALPRTAWLEIDLDALVANLGALRAAAAGAPLYPVVKADAYGHGAIPVARSLEAAGADGLCVATADEALVLRAAGIVIPILVLYPIPASLVPIAMRERIAVSVGDPELLRQVLAAAAAVASPDSPSAPLSIELEVETGLGRGGVEPDALIASARTIGAAPGVVLGGLWTHLQAPDQGPARSAQLARFDAACSALVAGGVDLPRRHATASTGLVGDGLAAYDGVRPGLAIYGLLPDELAAPQLNASALVLRAVLSLHARPVRVIDLPAGSGISYGPTFVTARPSRIATLPIGYGDGWSRALSNRASVLVRGARIPLVGNVAMDAIMADVTDVPGDPVTVADEFTLIGTQGDETITVAALAQARTTNAWEVVVSMAARVPRVYHARPGLSGLRTLTHWS